MATYIKVNVAHDAEYRQQNPRTALGALGGDTIGFYDLKEKNYGFECARCNEVEIHKECPNCGKTQYQAGYMGGGPGVFCGKCGIGWATWTCKKCGTENASARTFVKDGPCFIATAATGTPNSWQVHTLRQFRDDVLHHTKSGNWLVEWYYSWSPAAAHKLHEHPRLKILIRFLVSGLSIIALPVTKVSRLIHNRKRDHS